MSKKASAEFWIKLIFSKYGVLSTKDLEKAQNATLSASLAALGRPQISPLDVIPETVAGRARSVAVLSNSSAEPWQSSNQ
jgi:hypothetical protein